MQENVGHLGILGLNLCILFQYGSNMYTVFTRQNYQLSLLNNCHHNGGIYSVYLNYLSFASDPLWFIAPCASEKLNTLLIFTCSFISLYR